MADLRGGAELIVERRGRGLWLTLNRPDALNAVSPAILDGIEAALDGATLAAGVHAVVLTGAGRAFCCGADLKAARDAGGPGANDAFVARVMALTTRLEALPMPVVAAVNGLCIAAGLELILACDIVLAAESARFGDGHARYGLLPGAGASVRLPRKVGPGMAKLMMFTADLFPAERLAAFGLVQEIVPDAGLADTAEALVARLAERSPLGIARMKALVDGGLEQCKAQGLGAESLMSKLHAFSADRAEGLAAFAEKRAPVFHGR